MGHVPKPQLLSFIDDHVTSIGNQAQRRLNQSLYDHVSIMSFYSSITTSIELSRPEVEPKSYLAELLAADMGRIERSSDLRYALKTMTWKPAPPTTEDLAEIGELLERFSSLPWPKRRRDEQWLEQATECRERQTAVWDVVSRVFSSTLLAKKTPFVELFDFCNEAGVALYGHGSAHRTEIEAERDGDAIEKGC